MCASERHSQQKRKEKEEAEEEVSGERNMEFSVFFLGVPIQRYQRFNRGCAGCSDATA